MQTNKLYWTEKSRKNGKEAIKLKEGDRWRYLPSYRTINIVGNIVSDLWHWRRNCIVLYRWHFNDLSENTAAELHEKSLFALTNCEALNVKLVHERNGGQWRLATLARWATGTTSFVTLSGSRLRAMPRQRFILLDHPICSRRAIRGADVVGPLCSGQVEQSNPVDALSCWINGLTQWDAASPSRCDVSSSCCIRNKHHATWRIDINHTGSGSFGSRPSVKSEMILFDISSTSVGLIVFNVSAIISRNLCQNGRTDGACLWNGS